MGILARCFNWLFKKNTTRVKPEPAIKKTTSTKFLTINVKSRIEAADQGRAGGQGAAIKTPRSAGSNIYSARAPQNSPNSRPVFTPTQPADRVPGLAGPRKSLKNSSLRTRHQRLKKSISSGSESFLYPETPGTPLSGFSSVIRRTFNKSNLSYENGRQRLVEMEKRNEILVGAFPEKVKIDKAWEKAPWIHFLFVKERKLYTCMPEYLLSKGNPREDIGLTQAHGDFLYTLSRTKMMDNNGVEIKNEKGDNVYHYMFRLKKGAELPGHDMLIISGFNVQFAGKNHPTNLENSSLIYEIIASGEIYFHEGEIILYNRKSSSFQISAAETKNAMEAFFKLYKMDVGKKFDDNIDDSHAITKTVQDRINPEKTTRDAKP